MGDTTSKGANGLDSLQLDHAFFKRQLFGDVSQETNAIATMLRFELYADFYIEYGSIFAAMPGLKTIRSG